MHIIIEFKDFLPEQRSKSISSIQWYPEDCGAFIYSDLGGYVCIVDTNAFRTVARFSFDKTSSLLGTCNNVFCAKIRSSDLSSPLIAAAVSDCNVHLCDPRTGDSSAILQGHRREVTTLDWSPLCPHHLISGGKDGAVKLWDVRKPARDGVLMSLDWRQDQEALAAIDSFHSFSRKPQPPSASISIQERPIKYKNKDINKNDVPGRAGNRYAGPDLVRHAACVAHGAEVMGLRYSPCGRLLLSSGNDCKVRLWRARDGRLLTAHINAGIGSGLPYSLELAELGQTDKELLLLLPCDRARSRFEGEGLQSEAGDVCLHQLQGGKGDAVKVLKGHVDVVTACVFRKPFQQVISASKDGLILLWEPRQTDPDLQYEDKPDPPSGLFPSVHSSNLKYHSKNIPTDDDGEPHRSLYNGDSLADLREMQFGIRPIRPIASDALSAAFPSSSGMRYFMQQEQQGKSARTEAEDKWSDSDEEGNGASSASASTDVVRTGGKRRAKKSRLDPVERWKLNIDWWSQKSSTAEDSNALGSSSSNIEMDQSSSSNNNNENNSNSITEADTLRPSSNSTLIIDRNKGRAVRKKSSCAYSEMLKKFKLKK